MFKRLGNSAWAIVATGMLAAALGVALTPAAPAAAWTQPANTSWSYWAPGPPPGSESPNYLYATTANGTAFGEPFGQAYCLYGYGSACASASQIGMWPNQIVLYAKSGSTTNPYYANCDRNVTCTDAGPAGWGVVSVYYIQYTTFGGVLWEASWLG